MASPFITEVADQEYDVVVDGTTNVGPKVESTTTTGSPSIERQEVASFYDIDASGYNGINDSLKVGNISAVSSIEISMNVRVDTFTSGGWVTGVTWDANNYVGIRQTGVSGELEYFYYIAGFLIASTKFNITLGEHVTINARFAAFPANRRLLVDGVDQSSAVQTGASTTLPAAAGSVSNMGNDVTGDYSAGQVNSFSLKEGSTTDAERNDLATVMLNGSLGTGTKYSDQAISLGADHLWGTVSGSTWTDIIGSGNATITGGASGSTIQDDLTEVDFAIAPGNSAISTAAGAGTGAFTAAGFYEISSLTPGSTRFLFSFFDGSTTAGRSLYAYVNSVGNIVIQSTGSGGGVQFGNIADLGSAGEKLFWAMRQGSGGNVRDVELVVNCVPVTPTGFFDGNVASNYTTVFNPASLGSGRPPEQAHAVLLDKGNKYTDDQLFDLWDSFNNYTPPPPPGSALPAGIYHPSFGYGLGLGS